MLTLTRCAPMPPGERRMGFTRWPLRCPACERRVGMTPRMVFGTFTRCAGCREIVFVLIVPEIRAGFIAILKASEASDMGRRRLSPLQVLRELGVGVDAA